MRKRKKNLFVLLFTVLLGLGLGYALLSQDLTINGITKVKGNNWDIHFNNVQVSSGSVALSTGDSAASIDLNDNTLVNYTVTLNQPGDYYEFTVDVVNSGTIDGMVGSVVSKLNGTVISNENPLPDYLKYTLTHENGANIAPNHLLEAGDTETYKGRVEFKRDIDSSELPTTEQNNSFAFNVDYLQRTNAAIPVPLPDTTIKSFSYIIENDNLYCEDIYELFDRSNIITIIFSDEINPPANYVDSYDLSENQNGSVMAYRVVNAEDNSMYDLYIQGDGSLYANPDSSCLFAEFIGLKTIRNIEALNTSNVTNMTGMFYRTGLSNLSVLDLGNNFNTSKVTNMYYMFSNAGGFPSFTLDLGDKFDTSNVTNMRNMFSNTAEGSDYFNLDLGDKFDTSNVTDMGYMFYLYDGNRANFTLNLGDKFNTSNVTNMEKMFTGNYSFTSLDLGEHFDTSSVTTMNDMFANLYSIENIDLGDHFNTSNVEDMSGMFSNTGYYAQTFTLDLGDKFDTSNVTNLGGIFYETCVLSTRCVIDLGAKFDTSNATNMASMFFKTGYYDQTFTLDLGDKFDTSNATDMRYMFKETGYSNPNFTINLGTKFNTSKVTKMSRMFDYTGHANPNLELDLSSFDFSNVTDYTNMFYGMRQTGKIWVKNASDQAWVINHSGDTILTSSNVLIKN